MLSLVMAAEVSMRSWVNVFEVSGEGWSGRRGALEVEKGQVAVEAVVVAILEVIDGWVAGYAARFSDTDTDGQRMQQAGW